MTPKPWTIEGVAVVTGAGRGVGLAIARRLAERGATVVLADIDTQQAQAAAACLHDEGHAATSHHVDVADETAMEALAEDTNSTAFPLLPNFMCLPKACF